MHKNQNDVIHRFTKNICSWSFQRPHYLPSFSPTDPPKVLIVSPRQLKVPEGANITLECNVTGNPAPTIQWTKGNGSCVVISSQKALTILHFNQIDSGTYFCTASNGIGSPDTGSVVATFLRKYLSWVKSTKTWAYRVHRNMIFLGVSTIFFCTRTLVYAI